MFQVLHMLFAMYSYFGNCFLGRPGDNVVHLGNCLDVAGRTLFTSGPVPPGSPTTAWLILGGLVAVSLALLARRIRAVEVVE